ncbi:hypothetical protein [Novosphingobium huizhouense]|uniref:hypothetical protein n=1 Tax=Novosphingobium huizhouense TaxID=2866625 RepID=UPI001CD90BA1|nr:hypothetical protein [Novosphingobium huizhouense]
MPRAVLSIAQRARAAAQVQAAAVRDVTGQVIDTKQFASSINNAIDGTIIGSLQTKLDDLGDAIILPLP